MPKTQNNMIEFECTLTNGQIVIGEVKRGIIRPNEIPSGYNKYSLTYNIDSSAPYTIEPNIPSRHYGDIITRNVINFDKRSNEVIGVRIEEWLPKGNHIPTVVTDTNIEKSNSIVITVDGVRIEIKNNNKSMKNITIEI